MFNAQKTTQVGDIDELEKAVEEYRTRVEDLIRKEKDRQRQLVDEKTSHIITGAEERAQIIIADGERKAHQIISEAEQKAKSESSRIMDDAEYKAGQIVKEADEKIKKEAKDRVRREVENIIKKTREEAGSILEYARLESEKESNNIIARAKLEVEHIKGKAFDEAKLSAQTEGTRIIAESREKADKIANNTVERLKEINNLLNESILKTDAYINRYRKEVQAELEQVSKVIAESSKKIAEVMVSDVELRGNGHKTEAETKTAINGNGKSKFIGAMVDIRAPRIINEDGGRMFKGRMEMTVMPPYNIVQIKKLVDSIILVPNIKKAGEYGSEEEGAKITFEINEPVPLLSILGRLPVVISAVDEGDNIKLMLKP